MTRPALVLALCLMSGCAGTNVGTPPTPPQITAASAVNALAQAVDGAVTSAIAARDQGKVTVEDTAAIEAFGKALALSGKQIDAELRSADTWSVQKVAIIKLMADAGLSQLKTRISPGAQALVVSLVVIANQISSAAGGPSL